MHITCILWHKYYREWFPERSTRIRSIVSSDATVADLRLQDFDEMFSAFHGDLNDGFAHASEMKNFCAQFRPTATDTRFVD